MVRRWQTQTVSQCLPSKHRRVDKFTGKSHLILSMRHILKHWGTEQFTQKQFSQFSQFSLSPSNFTTWQMISVFFIFSNIWGSNTSQNISFFKLFFSYFRSNWLIKATAKDIQTLDINHLQWNSCVFLTVNTLRCTCFLSLTELKGNCLRCFHIGGKSSLAAALGKWDMSLKIKEKWSQVFPLLLWISSFLCCLGKCFVNEDFTNIFIDMWTIE